jgi:hypothetical protein
MINSPERIGDSHTLKRSYTILIKRALKRQLFFASGTTGGGWQGVSLLYNADGGQPPVGSGREHRWRTESWSSAKAPSRG